ncbi:MAG: hypothetical protein R3E92_06675 [Burkholderiaceae bacterium]|nr:hypothetical protein [Rhodoferax sp.]
MNNGKEGKDLAWMDGLVVEFCKNYTNRQVKLQGKTAIQPVMQVTPNIQVVVG